MNKLPFVLLAALLAACATAPAVNTVPLLTLHAVSFEGRWLGSLDATDDRRDGVIEFSLHRDGVFVPERSAGPQILWMTINGNSVTGALETYCDPVRKANVYTTFDALISGDEMRGHLRERVAFEWRDAGTWSAVREKP